MSHQAVTWVMEFSESWLADRLVLSAIAHRVSNESGDAWPSMKTVAREANVCLRQVYDSLANLKKLGEVTVHERRSRRGTKRYHLPKFMEWMREAHPDEIVAPKRSPRWADRSRRPRRADAASEPDWNPSSRDANEPARQPANPAGASATERRPRTGSGYADRRHCYGQADFPFGNQPDGLAERTSAVAEPNKDAGAGSMTDLGSPNSFETEHESCAAAGPTDNQGVPTDAQRAPGEVHSMHLLGAQRAPESSKEPSENRHSQSDGKLDEWPDRALPSGMGHLGGQGADGKQRKSSVAERETEGGGEQSEAGERISVLQKADEGVARSGPVPVTESAVSVGQAETPRREAPRVGESAGAVDAAEIAYQRAKRAYRRVVGKTMGGLGPKKREFARLVEEHGEELVVRAVQVWAEELGPDRCRILRWPLALFLSQAEEFVEAARESDPTARDDSGWHTAESIVPESWRPAAVEGKSKK